MATASERMTAARARLRRVPAGDAAGGLEGAVVVPRSLNWRAKEASVPARRQRGGSRARAPDRRRLCSNQRVTSTKTRVKQSRSTPPPPKALEKARAEKVGARAARVDGGHRRGRRLTKGKVAEGGAATDAAVKAGVARRSRRRPRPSRAGRRRRSRSGPRRASWSPPWRADSDWRPSTKAAVPPTKKTKIAEGGAAAPPRHKLPILF